MKFIVYDVTNNKNNSNFCWFLVFNEFIFEIFDGFLYGNYINLVSNILKRSLKHRKYGKRAEKGRYLKQSRAVPCKKAGPMIRFV